MSGALIAVLLVALISTGAFIFLVVWRAIQSAAEDQTGRAESASSAPASEPAAVAVTAPRPTAGDAPLTIDTPGAVNTPEGVIMPVVVRGRYPTPGGDSWSTPEGWRQGNSGSGHFLAGGPLRLPEPFDATGPVRILEGEPPSAAATPAAASAAAGSAPTVLEGAPASVLDPLYDHRTCETFVSGLDDETLDAALALFSHLEVRHRIDADALATLIAARPRELAAILTDRLEARGDDLRLPRPYVVGRGSTGQRQLSDHLGIAGRMLAALRAAAQDRLSGEASGAVRMAGLSTVLNGREHEPAIVMTLTQIEAAIGQLLPEVARARRGWWANHTIGATHGHARAWLSTGRVALPVIDAGTVTFELVQRARREGSFTDRPAVTLEAVKERS